MLTNFGNKYTPEMRQRTQQMGLTIHDVVTIASLVEREAQIPEERPTIADVYLSRWEQGWRLDADPTVQYALGTPDEWWPKLSGDDLFYDSPYNTYQGRGCHRVRLRTRDLPRSRRCSSRTTRHTCTSWLRAIPANTPSP